MQIRKALDTDLDAIASIEGESLSRWTRSDFSSELTRSFARFLAAVFEERVVGFVLAWHVADEFQINRLAVKKEFQMRRIGFSLLAGIAELAKECGANSIFLEVQEDNIPAIGLYLSGGFKQTGTRKNYYPSGHAVLMERKI